MYNEYMRLFKQVVFGIVFLLIMGVFFYGLFYLFFSPATYPSHCFDGVKNRDETGIDCGGSCQECEEQEEVLIRVSQKNLFPTENGVGLVIEIQNIDTKQAIESFDYTLTIKDIAGNNIDRISGSSFIYAGEIKHLIFPSLSISFSEVGSVDMNIDEVQYSYNESFKKPNIIIRSTQFSEDPLRLKGTIVNNETNSFSNISVYALLYNQSNILVGGSRTVIDELGSLESRDVQIVFSPDLSLQKEIAQGLTLFKNTLERGDSNEDVFLLQGILRELGFIERDPTGFFDGVTEDALRLFQAEQNISESGVLDGETRFILNQIITNREEAEDLRGSVDRTIDSSKTKIFIDVKR